MKSFDRSGRLAVPGARAPLVAGSSPTVVLVAESGKVLGASPKLEAHVAPGALHLAFSIVLFRYDGATLLQRRAATKYHFPRIWANACCSHPAPGEGVVDAGERRLLEELGVSAELRDVGTFTYRARCDSSGLVEHELDHVLVGRLDGDPSPDPDEVDEWRWIDPRDLSPLDGEVAPWLERALAIALAANVGNARSD